MEKINWRNVVLGGLVAGFIIDVVEGILEGVILGPEWRQAMQALGHPLRETGTNITLHVLLGFAYGLTALWLYAAIRPRFGAGPKTALYAGLGVWVLGSLLPSVNWGPRGLLPGHLFTIAVVVGLVEIVVATEAGAWLYKE
ncbi:MAG TPA: hypothetical protein VGR71_10445 [Nitrospira sp.]|nr:hypothetical protein [Nitrospira sp.]